MFVRSRRQSIAIVLSMLIALTGLQSTWVQAAMVTTDQAVAMAQSEYDQQQLLDALEQEQIQNKLVQMGVDPDQVKQRVASLTDQEIQQLNQQIEQLPAGSDVVGVVLTLFIVFIITDMLCATNIFNFVNCIN